MENATSSECTSNPSFVLILLKSHMYTLLKHILTHLHILVLSFRFLLSLLEDFYNLKARTNIFSSLRTCLSSELH